MVRYKRRIIEALISRSPRVGRFLLDNACAELSKARSRRLLLGRMSGGAVRSERLDADEIAGQEETGDVTAAVRQQLQLRTAPETTL